MDCDVSCLSSDECLYFAGILFLHIVEFHRVCSIMQLFLAVYSVWTTKVLIVRIELGRRGMYLYTDWWHVEQLKKRYIKCRLGALLVFLWSLLIVCWHVLHILNDIFSETCFPVSNVVMLLWIFLISCRLLILKIYQFDITVLFSGTKYMLFLKISK